MLPLALVPIFTRFLSPEDYGIIATATVLINAFVIFQGVQAYGLVARTYFDDDSSRMRNLVSTSTWFALVATIGIALLLMTRFGIFFGKWTGFPASWLPAVILLGFFAVLQNIYQSLLQARKEPWRFVANQTVGNILNLGISIWLIAGMHWDWRGRIWGLLVGGGIVSLMCVWGLAGRLGLLRPVFSMKSIREILHFGIPIIPHTLGGWVMTMGARLYLNNLASVADTGLFSLAFNLAAPLNMIIGSLNTTYYPWLFEKLSKPDDLDAVALCRNLLLSSVGLLVAGFVFGAAAAVSLPFVVGSRFYGAAPYVFWLSLTVAISGVYFIFGNIVVYSKRTSLLAWRADFLGACVVLVSCPFLISTIGPVGAAVANFIGVAASTIGCISAARVAHPLPWTTAIKCMFKTKN